MIISDGIYENTFSDLTNSLVNDTVSTTATDSRSIPAGQVSVDTSLDLDESLESRDLDISADSLNVESQAAAVINDDFLSSNGSRRGLGVSFDRDSNNEDQPSQLARYDHFNSDDSHM